MAHYSNGVNFARSIESNRIDLPDMTDNTEARHPCALTHRIHGLDAAVLNELVDSDPAIFKKFTLMFIDSFETAQEHIDSALEVGDRNKLRAMGHRAKSTARNIGAMALGDECETLESIAMTADIDEITRVVASLRAMFEVIRCELSRRIDPPNNGI